jgi:RHS repeat-associated protein
VTGYEYQDQWYASFDHSAAYTFDGVNRLVTAVATPYVPGDVNYNLNFVYTSDGSNGQYGNMSCLYVQNQTVGPCAVPQWTFSGSTNQLSNTGFLYDAAGDLTTDVSGTTTRNYAWDAEGRLYKVTDNGGNTSTTYIYNTLGQKVETQTTGWQLEQVFDPQGARVGYYSVGSTNQWLLAYFPFQGRELADYAYTTSCNFFHSDVLHSATIANSPLGSLIEDELFYPWGEPWQNQGSNTYDSHFAGIHASLQGPSLTDFTMYDAANRFYAPNPGRWHSPDPLGVDAADPRDPQTWNMYAYARNNPITNTDPSGLFCAQGEGCPTGDYPDEDDPRISAAYFMSVVVWAVPHAPAPSFAQNQNSLQPPVSSQQGKVKSMVDRVWRCLAQDADCLWWLGSLGGSPLARLSSSNFAVADLGPGGESARTDASVTGRGFSAAPTVFNSQGAFFYGGYSFGVPIASGGPEGQGLLLLHEVGHATGVLKPDRDDAAAQAENNRRVLSHCSKAIKCCGGH